MVSFFFHYDAQTKIENLTEEKKPASHIYSCILKKNFWNNNKLIF